MPCEIVFRRATSVDREEIVGLIKQCLGETNPPWDNAFWEWKHEKNPFGRSRALLAVADGIIVGLRVFMMWELRGGGQTVRAARAVDTATHPDWRGRGIFNRLTLTLAEQVAAAGVRFIFNTPNSASRPGYLKMGWRNVGRTSLFLRPLRPLLLLRAAALVITVRSHVVSPVEREASLAGEQFMPARQLLAESSFEDLLGESYRTSEHRLHTAATRAYLRWRFADIPHIRYYAARRLDPSGGAAMIFRLKEQGSLRELRICEIVATPGGAGERATRAVIRDVVARSGADYAVTIAPSDRRQQAGLLGCGFIPAPRAGPILTVRQLGETSPPNPLDQASWRLSIGDLELL